MQHIYSSSTLDFWGNLRVAHVYPARRAKGYYARALDSNGKRTRNKFFGHKRYGGAKAAYELACQYANSAERSRPAGTLSLRSSEDMPQERSTGSRRQTLASRYIDLRRSRSGQRPWMVIVQTGQGADMHVRRFDVATYGLKLALRNAITHQLQWEEKHDGWQDSLGIDNWVRLLLYIIRQHGTQPISLTDLNPPADIKRRARYVQCIRPGGRKRRFYHNEYGGRYRAHVAAIIWAIEGLPLGEVELAA